MLHILIAISWSFSVLLVLVGPLRTLTHSTCHKVMGRGFMFRGFIVKATGRGFEKKLWALI